MNHTELEVRLLELLAEATDELYHQGCQEKMDYLMKETEKAIVKYKQTK